LCEALQHEICALASFWRGSGNQLSDEIGSRDLWQRNNNVRQSPLAKDQDRLTLSANSGQIGAGRWDFAFLPNRRSFWE
jgi:hypothetical protein